MRARRARRDALLAPPARAPAGLGRAATRAAAAAPYLRVERAGGRGGGGRQERSERSGRWGRWGRWGRRRRGRGRRRPGVRAATYPLRAEHAMRPLDVCRDAHLLRRARRLEPRRLRELAGEITARCRRGPGGGRACVSSSAVGGGSQPLAVEKRACHGTRGRKVRVAEEARRRPRQPPGWEPRSGVRRSWRRRPPWPIGLAPGAPRRATPGSRRRAPPRARAPGAAPPPPRGAPAPRRSPRARAAAASRAAGPARADRGPVARSKMMVDGWRRAGGERAEVGRRAGGRSRLVRQIVRVRHAREHVARGPGAVVPLACVLRAAQQIKGRYVASRGQRRAGVGGGEGAVCSAPWRRRTRAARPS